MIYPSKSNRRQCNGRINLIDSDHIMARFMLIDKKQIVFWAEQLKYCEQPMTYDTFKFRLREYLKRTKQKLSTNQTERLMIPVNDLHRYAELYYEVLITLPTISLAMFFEQYIIVPPFNKVPSYEQFKKKLIPLLLLRKNMKLQPNIISFDSGDSDVDTVYHCIQQPNIISFDSESDQWQPISAADTDEELSSFLMDTDSDSTADTLCKVTAKDSSVDTVYRCINQATGSLGGNGSGGPIYGELTVGSMQRIIDFLVKWCTFGFLSRFLDVGAGLGKPNFHVAQNPGVRLSIGVEVESIRWRVGRLYILIIYIHHLIFLCLHIFSSL